jgi:hypothetical protein
MAVKRPCWPLPAGAFATTPLASRFGLALEPRTVTI